MHMHGGYGMIGYGIFRILIFIVAIFIVYMLIKRFSNNRGYQSYPSNRDSNPVNILKERYAKGEINEEEYRKRLRILNEEVED